MRKNPVTVLLTGLVLVSLVGPLAGCATSGAVVVEDDSGRVEVVFTDRDRRLIAKQLVQTCPEELVITHNRNLYRHRRQRGVP